MLFSFVVPVVIAFASAVAAVVLLLIGTFSAAIIALKNKDVDGVVINGANAAAYEREFAGELVASIKGLQSDPIGLVFRKGDENVAAFNEGLQEIKKDGTLDKLIAKYWGLK